MLACPLETKYSGTGVLGPFPEELKKLTPFRLRGSGVWVAEAVETPGKYPNIEAREPGATKYL